jgi:hypothetical protein
MLIIIRPIIKALRAMKRKQRRKKKTVWLMVLVLVLVNRKMDKCNLSAARPSLQ